VPWAKAKFKGAVVFAKIREDGSLDEDRGLVEIRYKPNDGRAYRGRASGLDLIAGEPVLGDEAVGDADAAPRASRDESVADTSAYIAYTDGACSGNPGPAGLGVILVAPTGSTIEGYEYLGVTTNNVAELTAIKRALEKSPVSEPITVHTDSQYAIGVLSKGWKAKANQELIASIKALLKDRRGVRFVYVRGHAGIPLNERADELARTAITRRDTSYG
jgi:ribonuclease HI